MDVRQEVESSFDGIELYTPANEAGTRTTKVTCRFRIEKRLSNKMRSLNINISKLARTLVSTYLYENHSVRVAEDHPFVSLLEKRDAQIEKLKGYGCVDKNPNKGARKIAQLMKLLDERDERIYKYRKFIGERTSNENGLY